MMILQIMENEVPVKTPAIQLKGLVDFKIGFKEPTVFSLSIRV